MVPTEFIISVIDCIPCLNMSSVILNAFNIDTLVSVFCNNLSFEITISAFTFGLSLSIPILALDPLNLPSNENGFVTIPIVSIPFFFASSAITGIAPVPVPPPIPAVTNKRSVPSKILSISSILSLAAFSPISGLAPAPNPCAISLPICNVLHPFVFALSSIPFSVFTNIYSTPSTSDTII